VKQPEDYPPPTPPPTPPPVPPPTLAPRGCCLKERIRNGITDRVCIDDTYEEVCDTFTNSLYSPKCVTQDDVGDREYVERSGACTRTQFYDDDEKCANIANLDFGSTKCRPPTASPTPAPTPAPFVPSPLEFSETVVFGFGKDCRMLKSQTHSVVRYGQGFTAQRAILDEASKKMGGLGLSPDDMKSVADSAVDISDDGKIVIRLQALASIQGYNLPPRQVANLALTAAQGDKFDVELYYKVASGGAPKKGTCFIKSAAVQQQALTSKPTVKPTFYVHDPSKFTGKPSEQPTPAPTGEPTEEPTAEPTAADVSSQSAADIADEQEKQAELDEALVNAQNAANAAPTPPPTAAATVTAAMTFDGTVSCDGSQKSLYVVESGVDSLTVGDLDCEAIVTPGTKSVSTVTSTLDASLSQALNAVADKYKDQKNLEAKTFAQVAVDTAVGLATAFGITASDIEEAKIFKQNVARQRRTNSYALEITLKPGKDPKAAAEAYNKALTDKSVPTVSILVVPIGQTIRSYGSQADASLKANGKVTVTPSASTEIKISLKPTSTNIANTNALTRAQTSIQAQVSQSGTFNGKAVVNAANVANAEAIKAPDFVTLFPTALSKYEATELRGMDAGVFDKVDTNGDGKIDNEEYFASVSPLDDKSTSTEQFELGASVVESVSKSLTQEEQQALVAKLSADKAASEANIQAECDKLKADTDPRVVAFIAAVPAGQEVNCNELIAAATATEVPTPAPTKPLSFRTSTAAPSSGSSSDGSAIVVITVVLCLVIIGGGGAYIYIKRRNMNIKADTQMATYANPTYAAAPGVPGAGMPGAPTGGDLDVSGAGAPGAAAPKLVRQESLC
jgi:hypothetical protein